MAAGSLAKYVLTIGVVGVVLVKLASSAAMHATALGSILLAANSTSDTPRPVTLIEQRRQQAARISAHVREDAVTKVAAVTLPGETAPLLAKQMDRVEEVEWDSSERYTLELLPTLAALPITESSKRHKHVRAARLVTRRNETTRVSAAEAFNRRFNVSAMLP